MKIRKVYKSFQAAAEALACGKESASIFEKEFGLKSGSGDDYAYSVKIQELSLNESGTFDVLVTLKLTKIKDGQ